jgi:phosphatidate phosphatase APP1
MKKKEDRAAEQILRKGAVLAEKVIEGAIDKIKNTVGGTDPVGVFPYRSFGNTTKQFFWGRVMEDEGIDVSSEDSLLDNLKNTYKRMETDEIPGATVEVSFHNKKVTAVTDEEGFYHAELEFENPISAKASMWETAHVKLLDSPRPIDEKNIGISATADVLVPPQTAKDFGIISDIDDTVLKTEATSLIRSAKLTFFSNAYKRKPFKGAAEFYHALVKGKDGEQTNPLFYVSSSMWNLYDLLVDFMKHNNLPTGPLLLRDIGLTEDRWIKGDHSHKLDKIRKILSYYPDLQFVLIGDSGQHDPELYQKAIEEFPDRVRVVYIREVSDGIRRKEVEKISQEIWEKYKIPMKLMKDSYLAAEHAADMDLITKDSLQSILKDKEKDEGK